MRSPPVARPEAGICGLANPDRWTRRPRHGPKTKCVDADSAGANGYSPKTAVCLAVRARADNEKDALPLAFAVQRALQRVAGAEAATRRGRAPDDLACARIARRAGRAFDGDETAEPDQAHLLARFQRGGHRGDEGIQGALGLRLVQTRLDRDRRHEFALRHMRISPPVLVQPGGPRAPPPRELMPVQAQPSNESGAGMIPR